MLSPRLSKKFKIKSNLLLFILLFPSILFAAQGKTITIKAVGDIMMGTLHPYPILPPDDGRNIFKNVYPYLNDCDILIGNLEGVFTSSATIVKKTDGKKFFAFNMPLHYIDYLHDAGFTVVNIANNHAYDFGKKGLHESISHLESNNLKYTGLKNQVTIIEKNGIRIGIVGFCWIPHFNNIINLKQTEHILKKAKKDIDILVVTFHGGSEGPKALHTKNEMEYFGSGKRGNVVAFAHKAIESGADLVIGHGPHVLRAFEFYNEKLIAYSLGNFCTYGVFNLKGPRNKSIILEVELNKKGEYIRGKIIPVILKDRGIPEFDPEKYAISLIKDLTRVDFPDSRIIISEDGDVINE